MKTVLPLNSYRNRKERVEKYTKSPKKSFVGKKQNNSKKGHSFLKMGTLNAQRSPSFAKYAYRFIF